MVVVAVCVRGVPDVYCSRRLGGIGRTKGGWFLVVCVVRGVSVMVSDPVSPIAGRDRSTASWSLWVVRYSVQVSLRRGSECDV